MAAGEALDGVVEEVAGAGEGGGKGLADFEGEPPGAEAGDAEVEDGDEGVACVEGAVAVVEEGELARDVAGGGDGKEGADAVAFGEDLGGDGGDAGEAALDFAWGVGGGGGTCPVECGGGGGSARRRRG